MDQNTLGSVKELMQKTADELGLELVSVKFISNGEMGPTLEVLIDHNLEITMDEIQKFTDIVSPKLDEIDTSDEQYLLDISSGGSEKELQRADLEKMIGKYLDITIAKSGEKITAKLVSLEDDGITVLYFIKGRRKQVHYALEELSSIRVGYKA